MEGVVLQLENKKEYQKNLDELIESINSVSKSALIVAPEVCLTDYDYENLEKACEFSEYALNELLKIIDNQILALTLLRKKGDSFVNEAVVINKHRVVHSQLKHKLFRLGNEHLYLRAGDGSDIKIFEINGVKFGLLICFELRYKELWQKIEGAEIILAPSQWGLPRKRHLEIISNGLAVINQAFVLVANSSKADMASSSGIYFPMGGKIINDYAKIIETKLDFKELKFMRRYLKL
ncbi:MAG: carbon-nitrogen hydrolase family protein [Epsilonproteobacteria bacterium]|nr:carbon-nitrogen hydrolase family protein [Campylobacterota bacterium]